MNNMNKENYYKNVTKDMRSVKDVDMKTKTVTGYLSVFNVSDSDNDTILPGAFARSIRENGPTAKGRIKFLREHNRTWNAGKFTKLQEDEYGLYFEATLNDTQIGKDLAILYESGEINEHSVMFTMVAGGYEVKDKDDYQKGLIFSEVKLWEGSAVTWGANEWANVTGLKSKFEAIEKLSNLSDNTLAIVSQIVAKLQTETNQSLGVLQAARTAINEQQEVHKLLSDFKKQINGNFGRG